MCLNYLSEDLPCKKKKNLCKNRQAQNDHYMSAKWHKQVRSNVSFSWTLIRLQTKFHLSDRVKSVRMEASQEETAQKGLSFSPKGTTQPLADLIALYGTSQQLLLTTNMIKHQESNTHIHTCAHQQTDVKANTETLCRCQQRTCTEGHCSWWSRNVSKMCGARAQVWWYVHSRSNETVCEQQGHSCKTRDKKQTYCISSRRVNQRAFKRVTHASLQVWLWWEMSNTSHVNTSETITCGTMLRFQAKGMNVFCNMSSIPSGCVPSNTEEPPGCFRVEATINIIYVLKPYTRERYLYEQQKLWCYIFDNVKGDGCLWGQAVTSDIIYSLPQVTLSTKRWWGSVIKEGRWSRRWITQSETKKPLHLIAAIDKLYVPY